MKTCTVAPGRFLLLAGVLAAGLVTSAPASAQWKWKDADGRTQYSDRPPPAGVPERNILSRPAGAAATAPRPTAEAASTPSTSASGPKGTDPALEEKKRQADAAEAARRKADEDKATRQRQENCQRAREAVRTLASGMRISRVNPQGEREVLDDARLAREVERARQAVASECR